jgi:hypothetical protein
MGRTGLARTINLGETTMAPPSVNLAAFKSPAKSPSPPKSASPDIDLDWQRVDLETLSPDLLDAYTTYRAALAKANTARKLFEDAMCSKLDLPSHLTLAFGYKFGNLSVAIAPAKRKSSARPALSLGDLIARADAAA